METVVDIWSHAWPFLVILTTIVFVHEMGHYLVARLNRVRVEVFSIGFGPEIFGFNDRHGTRWKFSALPLGGYVKFYGDAGVASAPGKEPARLTAEQRAVSFHHKRVGQRAAVVLGGPAGNFLFAAVLLAILFGTVGRQATTIQVDTVLAGGPAAAAGLQPGDSILGVGGEPIAEIEAFQTIVAASLERPLEMQIRRGEVEFVLALTPLPVEAPFGGAPHGPAETRPFAALGLGGQVLIEPYGTVDAIWAAAAGTLDVTAATLKSLGQMITGTRPIDELGGPVRIAEMSGQVAQAGLASMLLFLAVLSINLGMLNLLPVPMLDGGHLVFYLFETVMRRPVKPRIQAIGFRVGFAMMISLMIWVTGKDLVRLGVFGSLGDFGW